jgi:hypothetical protein
MVRIHTIARFFSVAFRVILSEAKNPFNLKHTVRVILSEAKNLYGWQILRFAQDDKN